MSYWEFILKSETETINLAQKIAHKIQKGNILAFSGDLGAGKTFLCRHIIKTLCGSNAQVVSPTFNLLQIYQAKEFDIYHFDLYRLKNLEEIYELGIEEALNQICLIEWPEIINDILPKEDLIYIKIKIIDNTTRTINISKNLII